MCGSLFTIGKSYKVTDGFIICDDGAKLVVDDSSVRFYFYTDRELRNEKLNKLNDK